MRNSHLLRALGSVAIVTSVLVSGTPQLTSVLPVAETRTNDPYLKVAQWYMGEPRAERVSSIAALDAWDPEWDFIAGQGEVGYVHDYDGDTVPKDIMQLEDLADPSGTGNYVGQRLVRFGSAVGGWTYALRSRQFGCNAAAFGAPSADPSQRCELAAHWVRPVKLSQGMSLGLASWVRFGWGDTWIYKQYPVGGDVVCDYSEFDPGMTLLLYVEPICQTQRRRDGGGVVANIGGDFRLDQRETVRFGVNDDWTYRELDAGRWPCSAATFGNPRRVDLGEPHCEMLRTRGSDTVIAMIDSGSLSHADLAANVAPVGGLNALDLTGADRNGIAPAECGSTRSHGLMMAGVAAAVTNNGRGIAGVAPQAKIAFVRVARCIDGVLSWTVDGGLDTWANAIRRSVQDLGASVLSVSVSVDGVCPAQIQQAVDDATAAGAVVVASAGNDRTSLEHENRWPADCRHVAAIGALDELGNRSAFSAWGQRMALSAPGENITTLEYPPVAGPWGLQDAYRSVNGTSPATAMVSGVAALMRTVNPRLSQLNVRRRLKLSARAFPIASNCDAEDCGYGMLDAARAMRSAEAPITEAEENDTPIQANYVSAPADISGTLGPPLDTGLGAGAGGMQGSCNVTIRCGNGGIVALSAPRQDEDWFEFYVRPQEEVEVALKAPDCPVGTCAYEVRSEKLDGTDPRSQEFGAVQYARFANNQTSVVKVAVRVFRKEAAEATDPVRSVPYTIILNWRPQAR